MDKRGLFYRNGHVMKAMAISFCVVVAVLAMHGFAPFGKYYVMFADWGGQYYPFLLELKRNMAAGSFPLWDWRGGGTDYVAAAAYYLVTPWNLLACLLPERWLPSFMSFSVAGHCALASGAMAWCLGRWHGNRGTAAAVAGCCFGMCGFFAGYFWNVIWLDTFVLTPIVAYGAYELLERGRFRMYVLALAGSLAANFYLGLFTCVLVLFLFIGYHVRKWDGAKGFLLRLSRMAAASVVAIGMCCVLLLPAWLALRGTYAGDFVVPDLSGFMPYVENTFGTFLVDMAIQSSSILNFAEPTPLLELSLPNVFCGTAVFAGWILFLSDGRVRRRERVFSGVLVSFMFVSFVVRVLAYAWHGFHFPNSIPHRFAYLVSFVMISDAFREWMAGVSLTERKRLAVGIWFAVALVGGSVAVASGLLSGMAWVCAAAGAAAVWLASGGTHVRYVPAAMAGLCVLQLGTGMWRGLGYAVNVEDARSEEVYPESEETVSALLAMEEPYGSGYWRTAIEDHVCANDAYLYGYDGGSQFTSMIHAGTVGFYRGIGAHGVMAGNQCACEYFDPVSDAVLGVRYRISLDGNGADHYGWTVAGTDGGGAIRENGNVLPFGFMADPGLADWDTYGDMPDSCMLDSVPLEDGTLFLESPFDRQSDFFGAAAGMDADLWDPVEPSAFRCLAGDACVRKLAYGVYDYGYCSGDGKRIVAWEFVVPEDGYYSAYMSSSLGRSYGIEVNGGRVTYSSAFSGMASLGRLFKGDFVEMRAMDDSVIEFEAGGPDGFDDDKLRGTRAYLERFDEDAFEACHGALAGRPGLELESRDGYGLSGTIDVQEPGLLFLPVPCVPGWTAEVDGEPAEIVWTGGMTGIGLETGPHRVRLFYGTPGLRAGAAVSAVSLAAFLAACACSRKKGRGDVPERAAHGIGGDTGLQRGEDHRVGGEGGLGRDGRAGGGV